MSNEMTVEEATKACRNGAIAALVMAVMTMLVVSVAMYLDEPGPLAAWSGPENILDVLILFACAFGMYRCSRAAAVVAAIYLIVSTVYIYLELGQISGMAVKAIFLFFFVKAAHGAWTYHRLEARDNPEYEPPPAWLAWVGIPLGLVSAGLMTLGVLTMTSLMPSTDVITGDKLSEEERLMLVESNVLYEDEKVELFYSEGFASIMEGGSVLSDRAVIAYGPDEDGEMEVYEFVFADIVSIEQESEGSTLEDAMYLVKGEGEDNWIRLILSTEGGGHEVFVNALKEKIAMAKENL